MMAPRIVSGAIDDVDAERPAPRVVRREEPADHRSEGDRRARDRAPGRERGRALAAREGRRQDRERRRHHQRRADALDQGLTDDQARHVPRQRGEQRSDREQTGADDEDAPVTVEVAEPAADHEQRRERQRVSGDDPLEARQRRVEFAQDGRDRDVEDRAVDDDDEQRGDDHRQRDPPARIQLGAVGGDALRRASHGSEIAPSGHVPRSYPAVARSCSTANGPWRPGDGGRTCRRAASAPGSGRGPA